MKKRVDENKDQKNPLPERDVAAGRAAPELETDAFSEDEQKKIVRLTICEANKYKSEMNDWITQRAKDIRHYNAEAPSTLENLSKEEWMSDRNLGLCPATCDAYQATLLNTCWNPDSIYFKATEANDVEHKEDLEVFTKWVVGPQECNLKPEIDDFINNRVTQGFSAAKVYWKVWFDWVDRRIPRYGEDGKFKEYEINTEKVRFERGVMENIADLDDLLMPKAGKTLQDKESLIHIIHTTAQDVIDRGKRGLYANVDEELILKMKKGYYDSMTSNLGAEKAKALGLSDYVGVSEDELGNYPVDLYEWYGKFEKNGKYEEYRMTVFPAHERFLAGKPLRKITRSGKRPFVGGPLIKLPGLVQGKSMPRLIMHIVNALNCVFNQKADFQYVVNCPIFFYNPGVWTEGSPDLKPGKGVRTSEPDSINMPNVTRSMAWAVNDIQLLLEILERLTGAASYFLTSQSQQSTATRDTIVNEKSENRFGLWVGRLIADISEGLTMLIHMYQDWAPPDLAKRVLGEDGKPLFPNLSIETLRGSYDCNMTPDIIAGSKTMEKEIAIWGLQVLSQTPWFHPQINPKGSWKLTANAAKKMGMEDIEKLMPPEPRAQFGQAQSVKAKITKIKQGETPEVEEGDDILELFMGISEFKETRYYELDPEYQPVFDQFYFKLAVSMFEMMVQKQQERNANSVALNMIMNQKRGIDPASAAQPSMPPAMPMPSM